MKTKYLVIAGGICLFVLGLISLSAWSIDHHQRQRNADELSTLESKNTRLQKSNDSLANRLLATETNCARLNSSLDKAPGLITQLITISNEGAVDAEETSLKLDNELNTFWTEVIYSGQPDTTLNKLMHITERLKGALDANQRAREGYRTRIKTAEDQCQRVKDLLSMQGTAVAKPSPVRPPSNTPVSSGKAPADSCTHTGMIKQEKLVEHKGKADKYKKWADGLIKVFEGVLKEDVKSTGIPFFGQSKGDVALERIAYLTNKLEEAKKNKP